MRAIIQRVLEAKVIVGESTIGQIGHGLTVLLGIEGTDTQEDITWLTSKITKLRIFKDDGEAKNLSVMDMDGEILVVSNFTLHANVKKGNRPTYIKAAAAEVSEPLYKAFIKQLEKDSGKPVKTGQFGAMMKLSLINDGPVTIIIDTKNKEL